MAVTLPLRSDLPHYSFTVTLDGGTYGFRFWWNYSCSAWVMDLSDSNGDPIVTGVRVKVDWPLFARYADSRLPPGQLIAQDTTGAQQDPGLEDLGSRVVLLYFTAEETGA